GGAGAGRRRTLTLTPGLGLVRGLLLDPPLRQRDRLCRLLAALAVDPSQLAVGIDEDTAGGTGPPRGPAGPAAGRGLGHRGPPRPRPRARASAPGTPESPRPCPGYGSTS